MTFDALQIERLQIVASGEKVYDQTFHSGVNAICGDNGSGKSTVVELLLYSLGGDVFKWSNAAQKCDYVCCQVSLPTGTATLKRQVTDSPRTSMEIKYSPIGERDDEPWQVFPYNATTNKKSFSQILFHHLNFPEVKADNNITIHQILRFLFIDQRSPLDSFIKDEPFDLPLTRITAYELLCGSYDDVTYGLYKKLRKLNERLSEEKSSLKSLNTIATTLNLNDNQDEAHQKILALKERVQTIERQITAQERPKAGLAQEHINQLVLLEHNIQQSGHRLRLLIDERNSLSDKIQDSASFIEALQLKTANLDESIFIRSKIGSIELEYCPVCLSKLHPKSDKICSLCGSETTGDIIIKNAMRMKDEVAFQLLESEKLQELRRDRLETIHNSIENEEIKLESLRHEYASLSDKVDTAANLNRDALTLEKGKLLSKIESEQDKLQIISRIERLTQKVGITTGEITSTKSQLFRKQKEFEKVKIETEDAVDRITRNILSKDIRSKKELHQAKRAKILVDKNTYELDGRNNFSASANVILKNSLRFSLLFASLEREAMRFPRIIICDNTEDKGMQEDRAHNFQDIITDMSNASNIPHQIIYTTSKPSPNIDNTILIGEEWYTEDSPTLKF
jgi:hypothetical protein